MNKFKTGIVLQSGATLDRSMYNHLAKLDCTGQLLAFSHIGEQGNVEKLYLHPTETITVMRKRPLTVKVVFVNVGQPGSATVLMNMNNESYSSVNPYIERKTHA